MLYKPGNYLYTHYIHSNKIHTSQRYRDLRLNTIKGPQPPVRFYTTSTALLYWDVSKAKKTPPSSIHGNKKRPLGTQKLPDIASLVSEDCLNKEGISLNPDFLMRNNKYNALTPFKLTGENLLAPLYITKSLLYSMENADRYLNKLSCNNLVKKFILERLQEEFIITARLGTDGTNILNTVNSKETFNQKKFFIGKGYYTEKSFNSIDLSSFRSNIFRLNKIHRSLHGRFNKDNTLVIGDKKDKPHFDKDWCGCYIIYSERSLYYYIGYSKVIEDRLNNHVSKIKKYHLDSYSDFKTRYSFYLRSMNMSSGDDSLDDKGVESCLNFVGAPLDFYIISCIKNKHKFNISMGPICLYKNFFIKFTSKYPDYKLSLLEHSILTYYTDLIGKIMEQSLISHYNPLLNSLKYTAINNITLDDNSLNIPYTSMLNQKVRYLLNTGDGGGALSPKSE